MEKKEEEEESMIKYDRYHIMILKFMQTHNLEHEENYEGEWILTLTKEDEFYTSYLWYKLTN